MTPENVKQSLADYIESQVANHSALTGVSIVLNGETATVDFRWLPSSTPAA